MTDGALATPALLRRHPQAWSAERVQVGANPHPPLAVDYCAAMRRAHKNWVPIYPPFCFLHRGINWQIGQAEHMHHLCADVHFSVWKTEHTSSERFNSQRVISASRGLPTSRQSVETNPTRYLGKGRLKWHRLYISLHCIDSK